MESEKLELSDAISHLLDECRMVLPGIQALFGFQMVAVFNESFKKMAAPQQQLHIVAIVLVVIAIAILMTPAALHRQAEPRLATDRFLRVASRLLLAAMLPLAAAICLDAYIVANLAWHDTQLSLTLALALAGAFVLFWIVLPLAYRARSPRA